MSLAARADVTPERSPRQGQPVVPNVPLEDNAVVPEIRDLLRKAIEVTGWTHEALAVEMALPDRFYVSKMLAGEKAITTKHLRALPDDVEALFAQLYAQAFGLIVVAPVDGEAAVQQLVTGLVSVLGLLPRRASRMAKAGVR